MLSLVFFLACYATSILLFLGGDTDQRLPTDLAFPVFVPLAVADIVLFLVFIFVDIKFFKNKINIPLIFILLTLFIIQIVVLSTTPLENKFEFILYDNPGSITIAISDEFKVMYILCFALLLLNIYISINYMLFRVKFNKHFAWICVLGVIGGFIFLIYSYITEGETYKLFLENMATTLRTYNPKSFTNNQNNFAAILLGAAFCSYSLYAVTRKRIFWMVGLFFCANTLFPMSRICLLLSIVLTLMIFAYKMIVSWKGHAFRNLNLIFLVVFALSLLVAMCYNVTEIKEYIENVVMTHDSSINSRTPLWTLSISLTTGTHVIFGNGHGYFNTVFCTILDGTLKMPHNLYVQTYGALGFVGLVLFACLILFIIYQIIRLFKNNRDAALISIIGLATILVYYLVEG